MRAAEATEPVHREFKQQTIDKYKNDSDYDYIENFRFSVSEWLLKILDKISKWLSGKIGPTTMPDGNPLPAMQLFLYIVAAIAVAAVIYLIFKGNWSVIFSGKKIKKKEEEYSVYDEDIHTINFNDEIETAVQQKNYRKATRLFYLKSLKLMADAGVIDWKLNKTNTDYRWEIKDKSMRAEFDYLSTSFDYVWYGEFEPTEEVFLQTFDKFRSFNKRFQTTEKA